MLSLRRVITSVYAAEDISIMKGDDQRVDDRGRSCTAGIHKSRTIRVSLHIIIMQDRHDLI
mgnify:CR=1 FL=1